MPKRKRESEEADVPNKAVLGAQQQRIQHKLKHGVVKVGHAFKIAKGFERQKLGRRRKKAASDSNAQEVQRIDAEVAALKTLDTTACGQHYLYKALGKIKAVATSPKLPAEVIKPTPLSTDSAVLNVNARLCNSNPVKEALPAVLTEIGGALGVDVGKDNGPKRKRMRAKDYREPQDDDTSEAREHSIPIRNKAGPAVSDSEQDEKGAPGADDSEDEFAQFDDRLGSSGDEDDEDEDLDVDDLERQLAAEGLGQAKPSSYDHAADLSISSEEGVASDSASPEPRKAPAPKKSAFLPSLTMGGYISGSGSEIDDDIDVAPKKNRRGQRARQQIWEKKFGAKAKHMQKQSRDQGWDPKRGATDAAEKPGRRNLHANGRSGGGFGGRGGAATTFPRPEPRAQRYEKPATAKQHRDDSGPIHPSWDAAKKAKERKEAPVAFTGKKITFE